MLKHRRDPCVPVAFSHLIYIEVRRHKHVHKDSFAMRLKTKIFIEFCVSKKYIAVVLIAVVFLLSICIDSVFSIKYCVSRVFSVFLVCLYIFCFLCVCFLCFLYKSAD